jgi:hypothetical protein
MAAAPKASRESTAAGWATRLAHALRRLLGRGDPLDAGAPRRAAPSRAEPQADATDERVRWKDACQALTIVLSKHPSARSVFRQLTMLENTLLDRGPKVIHKLPLELLEGALEQLETLVTDWSVRDLAYLRSQLSVVVTTRRRAERSAAQELSVLVTPERLQVREATDSVYMEFQEQFAASRAGQALRV